MDQKFKKKKAQRYAAYKKHTLHIKTTCRWKGERKCANPNPKKAGVAILISHKAYSEEGRLSDSKKDTAHDKRVNSPKHKNPMAHRYIKCVCT